MSDLLKAAREAKREAEATPDTPPLKDRCVEHVRVQLGIEVNLKDIDAKGGKAARFEIDGLKFTYEQHFNPALGWVLYVEGREQPVFSLADLAD